MSQPLISIDVSDIREGRLEELKAAMRELVEFVETNESDVFAYHVYFDEEQTRMTVLQVHPDSASMELHMKVAASAFPQFAELLTLSRLDLYGTPSEELLERLRNKAQMLGNAVVEVHDLHAGFARLVR